MAGLAVARLEVVAGPVQRGQQHVAAGQGRPRPAGRRRPHHVGVGVEQQQAQVRGVGHGAEAAVQVLAQPLQDGHADGPDADDQGGEQGAVAGDFGRRLAGGGGLGLEHGRFQAAERVRQAGVGVGRPAADAGGGGALRTGAVRRLLRAPAARPDRAAGAWGRGRCFCRPTAKPPRSSSTMSAQVGWRSSGFLASALGDGRLVARRQRRHVGRGLEVLQDQLADVGAGERPLAGEQFLVDDGQAVLVAETADPAVERLRGGVDRRDAAGDGRLHPFEVLDQAEVGDLDVLVDEEEVLRLDVEVLQLVLIVHQVQRFGGLLHVAEQLVARDAGQPWARHSLKRSQRLRSASSMTMMSWPSMMS